jgi:hypothetical protein
MTISELREAAQDLRDVADRVLLYTEVESLDDTWQRLEELFRQARDVLDGRAGGLTLEGVSPSWDERSKRANHVILACNVVEPPASGEIPGDYGA